MVWMPQKFAGVCVGARQSDASGTLVGLANGAAKDVEKRDRVEKKRVCLVETSVGKLGDSSGEPILKFQSVR